MALVQIEESKLVELIARSEELRALDNGGVDNWSHWCESRAEYLEEKRTKYNLDEDADFKNIAKAKIGSYIAK